MVRVLPHREHRSRLLLQSWAPARVPPHLAHFSQFWLQS
jgi:hypothetical protein